MGSRSQGGERGAAQEEEEGGGGGEKEQGGKKDSLLGERVLGGSLAAALFLLSASTSEARELSLDAFRERRVPFLENAQARAFLLRSPAWIDLCFRLLEVARGCEGRKGSREGERRQARIDARAQSFLLTPLALSDPSPVAPNLRRHPTNASLAPLPLESVATGHHALLLMQDLCGEMSTRETGRERGTRRKKAERGAASFFWPAGNARFATLSFSLSFSLSTLLNTHRDVARRAGWDLVKRRVAVKEHRGVGCLHSSWRERGDADDGEQRGQRRETRRR